MPQDNDIEQPNERTNLLSHPANDRRLSTVQQEDDAQSVISSYVSKDERALSSTPVGERLPYNDYTTVDWLHDLVRYPIFQLKEGNQVTVARSKIPTAFVSFTQGLAFDID